MVQTRDTILAQYQTLVVPMPVVAPTFQILSVLVHLDLVAFLAMAFRILHMAVFELQPNVVRIRIPQTQLVQAISHVSENFVYLSAQLIVNVL